MQNSSKNILFVALKKSLRLQEIKWFASLVEKACQYFCYIQGSRSETCRKEGNVQPCVICQGLESKPEKASATADTPRTSRRSVSAKTLNEVCFFCDAKSYSDALRECETLYLDMRVRKIVGHKIVEKTF